MPGVWKRLVWKMFLGTAPSFQRLGFAILILTVTSVVVGLFFPGIATLVLIPALGVGGLWVGAAANTRKDGFAGGLIFGWTGYLLGLLILLPTQLALASGIVWIPIGLLGGFAAGFFFGFIAGLVSAFGGYLGARLAGKPR